MDAKVAVAFTLTMLVAVGSLEAGEVRQQDGRQIWISRACEQPLAPVIEKADAQALNQSINRFNRYVEAVDAYNRCLSQEAGRDIEKFVETVNQSVRNLQEEAIAGVAVGRAALAGEQP